MKRVKGMVQLSLLALVIFLTGCSQQKKDREIKADITAKAKSEIAFAGVNYTVSNGIVDVTGVCPSAKERDKVESAVRRIAGVKEVKNSIAIGPVVLDADFSLKQSVDSLLMNYNLAGASVENSNVILTGSVPEKDLQKILNGLKKLPVAGVVNQLAVQ